ncbi:hypothetical protein CPA45_19225 [Vreelandella nigrificans]|uniref:Uncharacterized protein n=1 Tax=Vreelandella nigrificans TaxID=2042704 RepID=A0A2A4HID0_9GAMM|nr:hypothetical protein CPA45_19225 [Halomonas nigrificans]
MDSIRMPLQRQDSIDLFEDPSSLPIEVQRLLARYDDLLENQDPYKACSAMLADIKTLGYVFDYGLEGIPYELRPMNRR